MSENFSEKLDLESLLFPEQLSLNEERNSSLATSEYLLKNYDSDDIDLSSYSDTLKIDTQNLLQHGEITFTTITKEELFNILNTEELVTNPQLPFPKIKHINDLFWFLSNLNNYSINTSKLIFDIKGEVHDLSNALIEAAVFFGFLNNIQDNEQFYFIPTKRMEIMNQKSLKDQYFSFLEYIGSNKTVRDCINIQLNDPIYDRLSKQMVYNKLKGNENIIEEKLSNNEITRIVNNVRYWFLDIKKYLL